MKKKTRENMRKALVYIVALMFLVGLLPMLFGR
ncbi:DUF4044 domain-containing protein [Clostridium sp. OS1-26]|nr:DUF4044 domain-containing protein [Clostridium sp. OS1-26]WML35116.1 DUF4044 domain-containing protein [Clostridium sp. OS1-26]